ncbi:DUF417 family protein [Roseovarius sp. 2305UL8-3]|uniref:DUF417 family protein n=1 Tax=Roseovarius conchicola TaxID=3121636 RepID=UPI003526ED46
MTVFETTAPSQSRLLDVVADKAIFVALPIVFLWFGAMKFTAYEAGAIEGLVANSPFLALLYNILSVQAVSNLIGTVELIIAALLALRFVAPKLAAIGAAGAVATFAVTFSFFLSTPGVFIPEHGTLAISVLPGQFLLKDIVLLAASIWALRDALRA